MTTLNDAVSFASLKRQVDYFRIRFSNFVGFEPQSITATLRSGCVVYKAVMQYCTLSPVDFWSPTVILILSSCMMYIFKNGFWFLVFFFGGTSATFLDLVRFTDTGCLIVAVIRKMAWFTDRMAQLRRWGNSLGKSWRYGKSSYLCGSCVGIIHSRMFYQVSISQMAPDYFLES